MKQATKWTADDVRKAVERIGMKVTPTAKPAPRQLQSLTVDLTRLLPGLNGKDGLIRQHYRQATKVKDELLSEIKSRYKGVTFGAQRVNVVCTRHYCGTPMDFDNASSSFKHLMDAIVKAGLIADDGPGTIDSWTVRQVRVGKRLDQKMEVKINALCL